jgi:glycosyltransferase involved in cell wall biosynthesis
MKIFHVITTLERGGAENQLLILVTEQVRQGHSVTVFPLKNKLELKPNFSEIGAVVDTRFLDKNFVTQLKIISLKKNFDFDVIHCHLPQAELLTAFTQQSKRIISRHFGGQFYPGRNKYLSRLLSRVATKNAKCVVAISTSVQQQLIENKEVSDPRKIQVVEYGFRASDYMQGIETKELKTPGSSEDLLIGTIARLSPEKDLATLIKAFAICTNHFSFKGKIAIYGEGPERQKLTELIEELKLKDKVLLAGRTMSPASKMSKFDIFVLTSVFEGFGMVLLEAMACERPIVCSDISTTKEVLGDSGAAIFFEPGNEADLADKILNWRKILNPKFQENQIERLSMYSAVTMAEKIQENYLRSPLKSDSRSSRK